MKQKAERVVVKDKKIKKLFRKVERTGTEKDFMELLKRAVRPQK